MVKKFGFLSIFVVLALTGQVALSVDVQTEKARASEGAVRYEAEAESVETIDCVKEYASTASGGENGYNSVGKVDYNTSRVNFSVDIAEEGDYVLRLAYCARNANATTILTTEEGLVYSVACTNVSSSWNGFGADSVAETEISLRAGQQVLSFRKGTNYVVFDYIELEQIGEYTGKGEVFSATDGYVRYEAEDAELIDCSVSQSSMREDESASGYLYAANTDYSSTRVNFSVDVPEDGNYNLRLAYNVNNTSATTVLTTEEGLMYLIACRRDVTPDGNVWNVFSDTAVAETEISLRAGTQILSFRKGVSSVMFDYIELQRTGDYDETGERFSAAEGYVRHEAEDLIRTSSVTSENSTTASGHLYVSGINASVGLTLPIEAEEAGMYELAVGYALARGRESAIEVFVDGSAAAAAEMSSGRGEYVFSSGTTVSAYIWLEAGSHTAEIFQTGEGARFDFVDVRKLSDEELIPKSLTLSFEEIDLHVYEDVAFDPSRIEVAVTYADGIGERTLSSDEYTVSPPDDYDEDVAGEYIFTVGHNGVSATFTVTVHEEAAPLPERLEIDTSSMKLTVPIGQTYDPEGIGVLLCYANGMTRLLTEDEYEIECPEGYGQQTGKYTFNVRYLADPAITGSFEITVVTRYEAEEGETNAAVKSSQNASGGRYVGSIDTTDHYVAFTVTVPEAGEYDLAVAYAIGTGYGSAQFLIHNHEGVYAKVIMRNQYGWGEFTDDAVEYTKISLPAGSSSVIVYKYSGYAELDYIEIGEKTGEYKHFEGFPEPGPGEKPYLEEGYTRYEAEHALVSGCICYGFAYVNDYGVYSGQGFVGGLDTDDRYIEFSVTVEQDGEYEVKLGYVALGTASLKLYAGQYGLEPTCFLYATPACVWVASAWGEFSEQGIATAKVCLRAGENFIRIKKGTANVQVDYLDLGPRTGDYYDGALENVQMGDLWGDDEDDGYIRLSFGLPPAAIAGIAVGGVVLVGGTGTALIFVGKRRRKSGERK